MTTPALGNLVHEISTSTGTGNLTIAAVNGKQRASTAFGTGDNGTANPVMFISNRDAPEWEVTQCYFSDTNTLVRSATPIDGSSGAGVPVSFSSGTKDVTNNLDAATLSASDDYGLVTGAVTLSLDYGSVS